MNKKNQILKKTGVGTLVAITLLGPVGCNAMKSVSNTSQIAIANNIEDSINQFSEYNLTKEKMENAAHNYKVTLVLKDGTTIRLDNKFAYGIKIVNGRTSVAMKDIVDNIDGLELSWDDVNKVAIAKGKDKELKYPLNKRVMSENGKIIELDTSATADPKVSRTYLPFRSLMESLGYEVEYNHAAKAIDILEPGAPKQEHEIEKKPSQGKYPEPNKGESGVATIENWDEVMAKYGKNKYDVLNLIYSEPNLDNATKLGVNGDNVFSGYTRGSDVQEWMYKLGSDVAVYDISNQYKNFRPLKYSLESKTKDGGTDLMIGGALIRGTHRGSYQSYAIVDTNNNVYIGFNGNYTAKNGDTLEGKTIKTIYYSDYSGKTVLKLNYKKPIKVGKLVKDESTWTKNLKAYYESYLIYGGE